MPVVFNEPLSFLQRVVEYMEYGALLTKAANCEDPIERMEVRGGSCVCVCVTLCVCECV